MWQWVPLPDNALDRFGQKAWLTFIFTLKIKEKIKGLFSKLAARHSIPMIRYFLLKYHQADVQLSKKSSFQKWL